MRRFATLSFAVGLMSLGVGVAGASAFTPADGRYTGEYTGGNHGLGKVRLLKWSGNLACEGDVARAVDVPMTAARSGRTFSGYATYISPPGKDSFTGRFTATDALEATVRVSRGHGAERCDTGRITFVAHRVGP
jgi:hypothetical protein